MTISQARAELKAEWRRLAERDKQAARLKAKATRKTRSEAMQRWWAADFETTTTLDATGRVRVWSWVAMSVDGLETGRGTDINEFVEFAAERGGIYWFHNLRFDGSFLDAHLIDNQKLTARIGKANQTPKGQFTAMISDTGAHYLRRVKLADGREFEVRDSLKKFPGTSISDLAKMYNAPVSKGEIDYHAPRPAGYQPTAEEWAYIDADVAILKTALQVAHSVGNVSLTIGADALAEFKRLHRPGTRNGFENTFPQLPREIDDTIRQAYRGGWTYAAHQHRGIRHNVEGSVYDVNSMYPAVMYQESFPVGIPVPLRIGTEEIPGYPHVISGRVISGTLKPGYVPVVQAKNDIRYDGTEYLTEFEWLDFWGTEIDWKLIEEHYELTIEGYLGGYAFAGERGLFEDYIDKWMQVKSTTTGGMRAQAKFQLNNLWGKFGTNPLRASKYPVSTGGGPIKYETTEQRYDQTVYTPVAIYTTSYARDRICRAAQSFGDAFAYADTDSLHLLTRAVPAGFDIHDTRLGAWAHEADFTEAIYLRAKAYAELIDGAHVDAHVAGLPRHLLADAEMADLKIGSRWSGKLVPTRVPGGVILTETEYEIGEKTPWGRR